MTFPSLSRLAFYTNFLIVNLCLVSGICLAESSELNFSAITVYPQSKALVQGQSFLSRESLSSSQYTDINSSLVGVESINLIQAKSSALTSITLRGASGGQGLITFDGVPLFANLAGFYSLRHFPTEVVENLTVQRGFQPNVNNSNTLGGSISLNSRRVDDGKVHLKVEAGSNQTLTTSIASGWGGEDFNATVVLGRTHVSDGDTQSGTASASADADDYRMERVLLRVDKSFELGYIEASAYYLKTHEDSDGPGLTPDFKVAWLEDLEGWFTDEVLIAQVNSSVDITSHWQSSLQLAYTQDKQNGAVGIFPVGPLSMDLTSRLSLINWQNDHLFAAKNNLLTTMQWGLDIQHQSGEAQKDNTHEAQTLVSPNIGLNLAGSDWNIKLNSQWNNYDAYDNNFIYSLGAEWQFLANTSIWANVGKHYRAPGVNERLHPIYGNSTLQAEQSSGAELGLRWQIGANSHINVSVFKHDIKNLIVLALDPNTGVSSSNNIGKVETIGAELSVVKQLSPSWKTTLNYSYMDAANKTTDGVVAVRPDNRLNLINMWKINNALDFRIEVNAHDGFWFDAANTISSGSVVKVNTLLNYQLSESSQIYFRVDNLSNDDTVELYGFNYSGRSMYMGVNVGW